MRSALATRTYIIRVTITVVIGVSFQLKPGPQSPCVSDASRLTLPFYRWADRVHRDTGPCTGSHGATVVWAAQCPRQDLGPGPRISDPAELPGLQSPFSKINSGVGALGAGATWRGQTQTQMPIRAGVRTWLRVGEAQRRDGTWEGLVREVTSVDFKDE